MFVNWLVIASKRTHEVRRAVEQEPIVDVAGLVWQFDRVEGAQRELMRASFGSLSETSVLTKREEQLQRNQLTTLPDSFGNLTALIDLWVSLCVCVNWLVSGNKSTHEARRAVR